ncbi:YciI family protein [Catenulispora pinisilvae]|uniref:YciI family protein n=1 Tax=Catenulispora pinisilvae TaxID=2705253 RepID=UPI0018917631|nr:YciI family protein [Catenulispora pinisilvae]
MPRYLLSIYQPDGPLPSQDRLAEIHRDLDALNDELKAAGGWVFDGGLHPASTATVLRPGGGDVLITDGPFVDSKEHLGGIKIVDAPDLDAALGWGAKLMRAIGLPVEVRPFLGWD